MIASYNNAVLMSEISHSHINNDFVTPNRRSNRLYLKSQSLTSNTSTNTIKSSISPANNTTTTTATATATATTTKSTLQDNNNKIIGKKRKRNFKITFTNSNKKRKLNSQNTQNTENTENIQNVQNNNWKLTTRKKYTKLEDFQMITNADLRNSRRSRSNGLSCKYRFGNKWIIEMDTILGRLASEVKPIIELLSRDLRSVRVKLTLQTQNKVYIIWIRDPSNKIVSASIIQIDYLSKRVNIEMLATDLNNRGKGLAEIIIRLIQFKMYSLPYDYQLFVSAAKHALPFWLKPKYEFRIPSSYYYKILHNHELIQERKGDIKHLMWYGNTVINTTTHQLFKLFKNFNNRKKKYNS